MGEEKIPIKFKPSSLENDIIKGKINTKIPQSTDGIKLINPALIDLVIDQGFLISEWIEDDSQLENMGYVPRKVQLALGSGTVRAWIKKDILVGEMIGNESLDHYSTLVQIAGNLNQRGIKAEISHLDGADITFEIAGKRIYLEYEHGEQSPQILQEKKHNITDGKMVFIGHAGNLKYLNKVVGEDNTVKRGLQLLEYIDNLIESEQEEKKGDKTIIPLFPVVLDAFTGNRGV